MKVMMMMLQHLSGERQNGTNNGVLSSDHLKSAKEERSRKRLMLGKLVHTGLELPRCSKQLRAHKWPLKWWPYLGVWCSFTTMR